MQLELETVNRGGYMSKDSFGLRPKRDSAVAAKFEQARTLGIRMNPFILKILEDKRNLELMDVEIARRKAELMRILAPS